MRESLQEKDGKEKFKRNERIYVHEESECLSTYVKYIVSMIATS